MKRYIYVLFMFITLNLWACSDSEPSTDGGGEEVVDKTTDCQSANEKGAYTTWYKPANGWVARYLIMITVNSIFSICRTGVRDILFCIRGTWFIQRIFPLLPLVAKRYPAEKKMSRMWL